MFQKITLENFQSHKHSELELSPGVNVIIGDTDSGKSAIIRALYWLTFGKPAGTSFVRHRSSGNCCVAAHTDTAIVKRERDASTQRYTIIKHNDEANKKLVKEVYKGFGQTVPPPVAQLLNLTDLNFMRQMDPPFLFSKTAGEVAQYLNRLIDLEIIDYSLLNIKRMSSHVENSLAASIDNINRWEAELAEYDWLKEANVSVAALEQKEAKIRKLKQAVSELDYICKIHTVASHKVEEYAFSWKVVPKIEALINWQTDLAECKKRYNVLRNAILYAQKTKTALTALPNAKRLSQQIVAIERAQGKLQAKQAEYRGVSVIVNSLLEKADNMQRAVARCKQAALQLKQAMPDTCPLCDQPIRRK